MKWLNYNHLYYFWMVAREGSIARAAEELMLSQPTISVQLKELETALGHRLFDRVGRGLRLSDPGRIAFNYANETFALGHEMTNALESQAAGRLLRLSVGVLDAIPKPLVRQLLAPGRYNTAVRSALRTEPEVRVLDERLLQLCPIRNRTC